MTHTKKHLTLEEIADVENFDPAKIATEPSPIAKEIMEMLSEKIFIISEYTPIKKYDEFIDITMNSIAEGFEFLEFRDYPVMYKFYNDPAEEVKTLPFRHFLVNIIMWRPMMCIDETNLHDGLIIKSAKLVNISRRFIKDYFDNMYILPYKRGIPMLSHLPYTGINRAMNEIMADTTFKLSQISGTFNSFIGIGTSIETFIDLETRIPEFRDVMNFKLDGTMQPAEQEAELAKQKKKIVDLIINDDRPNMMKALVQPQSGLNINQLSEMICTIGLKPDDDGRTIPYPINSNFLNQGGLNTSTLLYLKAISGRKAHVTNNEYMGKMGYTLNNTCMLAAGSVLSRTTLDCNTVNPILINIISEDVLKKFNGRRYRYAGQTDYQIIDARVDKHLIGMSVYMRSPITCACKDGICAACYGELYYTNIDNWNAGIYSGTKIMNPVMQGILGIKHLQTTTSNFIKFRPEFNNFFSLSGTEIVLCNSIEDIMQYSLIIRREDIVTMDGDELEIDYSSSGKRKKKSYDKSYDDGDYGYDESGGDSSNDDVHLGFAYHTTKFEVVRNLHNKNPEAREYIQFEDVDSKELFMHEDLVMQMVPGSNDTGDYLYIDLCDLNPEEFIFLVDVENNEITKPMKLIKKALNSKTHDGCNTYDELTNRMVSLIIESKLDAMSIHAEMIIRQLVRQNRNILKRPRFDRIVMSQDYQMLRIDDALVKNPSITTSISSSYLKRQLIDLDITYEKSEPGIFDSLFRRTLDTGNTADIAKSWQK